MNNTIARLIYRESGGFTGLQRGCAVEPGALPAAPRDGLQSLLQAATPALPDMPDMQVYTLELVMQPNACAEGECSLPGTVPQHRVLRYLASDVPEDLSALIGYLRDHAQPLEPR